MYNHTYVYYSTTFEGNFLSSVGEAKNVKSHDYSYEISVMPVCGCQVVGLQNGIGGISDESNDLQLAC